MKHIFFWAFFLLPINLSQIVTAHSYHYEIQVSNELHSSNGLLDELNMTWFYDEDVSNVMLQDQTNLKKLGNKLINDLELLGYFTQLKLNDKIVALKKAKNIQLKSENDTLILSFTLPLKTAIKVKKGDILSLNHEDPGAIAILYYEKPSEIMVNGSLKKHCKPTVKEKGNFSEGEFPQIVKIYC